MPYEVSMTWSGAGFGRSADGTTARAKAQVRYFAATPSDQGVTSIAVDTGGTYTGTAPTITFTGGGGTGARAYAVLNAGGTAVASIVVVCPGAGYTSAPTVVFSSGGATATATIGDIGNSAAEASRATQASTAVGVPQVNDAHPTDSNIFVRSSNTTTVGPAFYEVDIEYSAGKGAPGTKHTGNGVPNPASTPRQYRFTPVTETLYADRDYSGYPIVNSAGTPFDGGLPLTRNYRTMEVVEVRSNYSNSVAASYENTVNNADWTISELGITITSGSAKCTRIVPLDPITSGTTSIRVGYYFEIRGDGHKLQPLDVGVAAAKSNGAADATRIADGDGNPVSKPVALNGKGGVLYASGEHLAGRDWTGKPSYITPTEVGGGTGWKLTYTMYETKDFSAFGF